MIQSPRRRRDGYFPIEADSPAPLIYRLTHRVRFSEVDAMQVMWHGRYAQLFEQGNEELCRRCGLSHADFRRHQVLAPIVQLHVDYFAPLMLGEQAGITAKLLWSDAARLNIEYQVHKENGQAAASGYTVQMFVDPSGQPLLASPPILDDCRRRWIAGEWDSLK